ncbi:hypothetical protein C8E00_103480 [Chromohalobacter marismortui]|uniref:Uncharacterized protein n=1 Tax=Chromohalobacter marismortui TaxID=42055 RepID=A0A4V3F3W6_9GAMM|nr:MULTISPECIES: hypothetical protein [Chromohalobacter]MCI0508629.1 hypothetical protein [Chromohalobacter sp.]TDU23106.1 hypothetical protein C8E00_103480 [Chromohalobacter marismortui]
MKTDSKNKSIHYKFANITTCSFTLQDLIKDVFSSGSEARKAKKRLESISQDEQIFRLVNHYSESRGMFFGQLVVFENGKGQALLTIDDDSEYFLIDSLEASEVAAERGGDKQHEEEGRVASQERRDEQRLEKRKEFVESMLYFGVKDNHLVVIQSMALKARDLETHLKWLFEYFTEKFSSKSALILQDKPAPDIVKKIEKNPAKSICLGAPIETGDGYLVDSEEHAQSESDQVVSESSNKLKFSPKGMGADIVRALIDQDWFDKQDLKESLDDANLKVSLEITYLRKTTKKGHQVLDNMATALRHQHEDDVKIYLDGGGVISGEDLKLTGRISVKTFNGMVDENDLFDKMKVWLKDKIATEQIDPGKDHNAGSDSEE